MKENRFSRIVEAPARETADVGIPYQALDQVRQYAEQKIVPWFNRAQAHSPAERDLTFIGTYFRMFNWVCTLALMNSPRHFQGAAAGARTLFELLLDVKLLAADPTGDRAARFFLYAQLERLRVAEKLLQFEAKHPDTGLIDASYLRGFVTRQGGHIRTKATTLWHDKNGKLYIPKHWSGISETEKRAQYFGPRFEAYFRQIYPYFSWFIHPGAQGYIGLPEEAFLEIYASAMRLSRLFFLEATQLCVEELKIKEALRDFDQEMEQLILLEETLLAQRKP